MLLQCFIINSMILLSIATLLLIALIAITFLKVPNKLILLSACVSLLVLVNFLNEIQAGKEPKYTTIDIPREQQKAEINQLQKQKSEEWKNISEENIWGELIQEQKMYANLLIRTWQEKVNSMFYFQGLHQVRVKMLVNALILKANSTDKLEKLSIYRINFQKQKCNIFCLQSSFRHQNRQNYNILIIQNIKEAQDLSNMEDIYFQKDITILFESAQPSFRFNSVARFSQHYLFSDNYVSKFIGHYSSKLIEACLAYRSLNYQFYAASHNTPLEELCSRELPPNRIDKCIRKLVQKKNDPIPVSWVRKCYEEEEEGELNDQNGWIYPRKGLGEFDRTRGDRSTQQDL